MSLPVSIHDVTPALEPNVLRLWEMCAARGLSPALLVVPDWQGEWPLRRHPRFDAGLGFSEDARSIRLFPGGRDLPATLNRWLGRHSPITYAALREAESNESRQVSP